MKQLAAALGLLALCLNACATHQVRFEPWRGLPSAAVPDLQQGLFAIPKEKLMDAAAATLEHEPYFHWTFDSLDKANGLIIGSAGLFREVQLRITDAEGGKSRMAMSVPRRMLKAQAKIYALKTDPARRTAYEPEAAKLDQYHVIAADVELDEAYFYSFTYRVLNDRTQVPFGLKAYQEADALGQPPVQSSTPEAAVAEPVSPAAGTAPAQPAHRE